MCFAKGTKTATYSSKQGKFNETDDTYNNETEDKDTSVHTDISSDPQPSTDKSHF